MKTHGESKTRLYMIWWSMKSRCNNDNIKVRRVYKDRGITYTKEWQEFVDFKSWAIQNGYDDNLSLDRINNYKGYEPDNCRFVTLEVQHKNRRPKSEWYDPIKEWNEKYQLKLPL